MKTTYVVTVTSPDRPGVVNDVARIVLAHGGSWQESRMVRLGGLFAGLIRVEVDTERAGALVRELQTLGRDGMSVTAREARPEDRFAGWRPLRLVLSGADHEGIVQGVAQFLAEKRVNVEELVTDLVPAPFGGGPLFSAEAKLRCPPELATDELRGRLTELGASLGVEMELEEASGR
jgi:glycine cleavage system regulatory protein